MDERRTNIQVKKSTRDALASLGGKDDTYDDIIQRLLTTDRDCCYSMPVETPKGVEEIEICVPKHITHIKSTNILGMGFNDALCALCEKYNIKWDEM